MTGLPLFDWLRWQQHNRAARNAPLANCAAASKRQRAFVKQLLRAEVGK